MRRGRPSTTAQVVCCLRAALSAPGVGILEDRYAHLLLAPPFRLAAKALSGRLARPLLAGLDIGSLGIIGMLAIRTRYFDEEIRRAAADGVGQVVLLGAGYDARALRLLPAGSPARFFEVDHPATQQDKRARLAAAGLSSPATFVAVDFTRDDLLERLGEAGHDRQKPTFFLWEGVTMYLDEPQVRATLRALSTAAAPGSRLSFDAVPRAAPPLERALVSLGAPAFALLGEPLRFRADPEALRGLLSEEGWRLSEALSMAEGYARYLSRSPLPRPPRPIFYLALAER